MRIPNGAHRGGVSIIMMLGQIVGLALLVLLLWAVVSARRARGRRRRGGGIGAGASGAIYELLNEDKRRAIEIIVEQRAAERDPETADGNLPDLERPTAARDGAKAVEPGR